MASKPLRIPIYPQESVAGTGVCTVASQSGLELHKEGTSDPVFAVAKIGTPARHHRSWSSGVSSRWSDTSRAGKVWHVRRAVVVLQTIGEVLAGHVICSD